MTKAWTELELTRLRVMVEGKIPVDRIAQAYGRTELDVRKQVTLVLGTPSPAPKTQHERSADARKRRPAARSYHRWTDDELTRLRGLHAQGYSHQAIANIMGLSIEAVHTKAVRERLRNHPRKAPNHIWTDVEVATLRTMKEAGFSSKQIADAIGIEEDQVRTKAVRERIFKWGKQ